MTTRLQWSKAKVNMTKATMRASNIKALQRVCKTTPEYVSLFRSLRIILIDQLKIEKDNVRTLTQ